MITWDGNTERRATPSESHPGLARRECCPTCGQSHWLPICIEPDESVSIEDIPAKNCTAPGCARMLCGCCEDNRCAATCEGCEALVCSWHIAACECGCRCSWCPGCLEMHYETLIEEEDPYAAVLLADRARRCDGEHAASTEPGAAARALLIVGIEEEEL